MASSDSDTPSSGTPNPPSTLAQAMESPHISRLPDSTGGFFDYTDEKTEQQARPARPRAERCTDLTLLVLARGQVLDIPPRLYHDSALYRIRGAGTHCRAARARALAEH